MSRLVDNILTEIDDCGLDRSVISIEPEDGAAIFDMVFHDVHTLVLTISGGMGESIHAVRFIVEDQSLLETAVECVEIALYLEFPEVTYPGDPGLEYTITRYQTAMYDAEPTRVSEYTGMTGSGLAPFARGAKGA